MLFPLLKAKDSLFPTKLAGVALLSCTLISGQSLAELRELSDESLETVVGKAGLTIDIETQVSIAEFLYVDAGGMYWRDYSLTGIGGGLVDNIRATVDITDGVETLAAGFSDMAVLADMGLLDENEADVAWAKTEYDDGAGGYGKKFGDGDLFIHVASQDYGLGSALRAPPVLGNEASNLALVKNAVDLHVKQGDFGITSSDGSIETSITRNVSIEAYLGYVDILITNRGNGYHDTSSHPGGLAGGLASGGKPTNISLADSYISLDIKFRVEDMDIDSTNNVTNPAVPLAVKNPYLTLRDFRIHNERGEDTEGSFGFASVESKIGAARGIINTTEALIAGSNTYVDGQAIYDIDITWDWDLPHISFGDTGTSIGAVYFTDFQIRDTSLVISAH